MYGKRKKKEEKERKEIKEIKMRKKKAFMDAKVGNFCGIVTLLLIDFQESACHSNPNPKINTLGLE